MRDFKYKSGKKTDGAIKRAFAELLVKKKALNRISVADLARQAGITRGTFYAHYNNVYDVALDIENELFDNIFSMTPEEISELKEVRTTDNEMVKNYIDQIFQFLKDNEKLYSELLSSDTPMMFVNKLNTNIKDRLLEQLEPFRAQIPTLDLDVSFFTDGAVYLIIRYFRHETKLTLDEIKWYLLQKFNQFFIEK